MNDTRLYKKTWNIEDIQFGDRLPFPTLVDAYEWHVRIGANYVERRLGEQYGEVKPGENDPKPQPIDEATLKEIIKHLKEDREKRDKKRKKNAPLPRDLTKDDIEWLVVDECWIDLLVAMGTWCLKHGLVAESAKKDPKVNILGNLRLLAAVALKRSTRALVTSASSAEDEAKRDTSHLRSFLLHMISVSPWLGNAWQYDDPLTERQKQLGWHEPKPFKWYRKEFGIDGECLRSALRRHDVKLMSISGRSHVRPRDVAEFFPDEFGFEGLLLVRQGRKSVQDYRDEAMDDSKER